MPSTYAHRRFGANVLDHLPAPLREKLEAHRELYDIGLHGPDLLFITMLPSPTRWVHWATPCTRSRGGSF